MAACLNDGAVSVPTGEFREPRVLPARTWPQGNYPNPFNPQTQIRFDVAEATNVELLVFDMLGHAVRRLVSQTPPAGAHAVVWDGRDASGQQVSGGTYICRLVTGAVTQVRRMLLLK